jgi:hypothetical protein
MFITIPRASPPVTPALPASPPLDPGPPGTALIPLEGGRFYDPSVDAIRGGRLPVRKTPAKAPTTPTAPPEPGASPRQPTSADGPAALIPVPDPSLGGKPPTPPSQSSPIKTRPARRTKGGLRPIQPGVKLPPIPTQSSLWNTNAGREHVAYTYLLQQLSPPLVPFQVAALIGNMMYESRDFTSSQKPTPVLVASLHEVGGAGFGIAQWTEPHRVAGLNEFARDNKLPVSNFGLQLAYVALELKSHGELVVEGKPTYTLVSTEVLAKIAAKPDLASATEYIMNNYESPIPGSLDDRVAYARQVLAHR